MGHKNVKITDILQQKLVDSISYYAQARLSDQTSPYFVDMNDKFDIELEIINKVMKGSIVASVGILSEFLKIDATSKNKIESLHRDIMASLLVDCANGVTPLDIQEYQKLMLDKYGYDFSNIDEIKKSLPLRQ